jgi:Ca-activated chloride channel homolog
MKLQPKILLLLSLLLILLPACSQEESLSDEKVKEEQELGQSEKQEAEEANGNETEEKETEIVEVEPLPKSYDELAGLPVGEYSDFNPSNTEPEKTLEAFKELPDISSDPAQEQLDFFYRELLSKVQKEFKGPEDLIRQMRFQSIGDPDIEDSRYQLKENLNVEIILDASGSMAQPAGNKAKMEAAKETITKFVEQLPEEAKVGLRVYGHKGSNADSDKNVSCSSSEEIYKMAPKDPGKLQAALKQIKPTGWTPTGMALREAKKDLEKYDGENNTNIVYLVSDGVSTCDDNPVEAAEDLFSSNISPIINVIGFDVDSEGQNELIQIAEATDGIYQKVNDENELQKEFDKITDLTETWKDWKTQNKTKLERKQLQNSIDIFSYITTEEHNATFEKVDISMILSILQQNGKMDKDSYQYLDQVNAEYHNWIAEEIETFKTELKSMNDKSFGEAIKALEEKYKQNAQ